MVESRKTSPVNPESLEAGYEVKDASARWIFVGGIGALLVGFVIHLCYWWLFLDYKRSLRASRQPRTAIEHEEQIPPEPRLQLNPQLDLIELHRKNIDILTEPAWVDRAHGWARIPIQDAMELLVRENEKARRAGK